MSSFNNFRGEKHTLPFSAFRPICQKNQNLTSSSSRQSRNHNYQYHSSLDQFSYPDPNYHIRQQNINYYPYYFQQHQQWEQSIHQQRQLQQQQQQRQQQRRLIYLQHEQRQQLQKKQLCQRKFYQYCLEQNQQNTVLLHVPLNNNDNSTQLQSRRQSKPVTVKQNRIKSADSPSLYSSNRSGIGDKSFGRKCEIRKPGYNKNDPICIDIDDDEKKITGSSRKINEQHPLDKPPAAITGKGNELIGLFNDDSDVIIAEKEKEASTDAYDDNTNINITIDDDVCIIIGSTGTNFIHARENCVIESFAIDPHKYCKKCFCYVCDMNASDCASWGSHCHAKSSESKWKNLRSKMRSKLTATATTAGSPSISSRKNFLGKEAKQNNI